MNNWTGNIIKGSLIVLFIVAALYISMKPKALDLPEFSTIHAESIILHDKQGNMRIKLALYNEQYPYLAFFDKNNSPRIELILKNDNSWLSFHDRTGMVLLSVSFLDGVPGFHLYDKKGKRRAVFGISSSGPRLDFLDANGLPRFGFIVPDEGDPCMYESENGTDHFFNLEQFSKAK